MNIIVVILGIIVVVLIYILYAFFVASSGTNLITSQTSLLSANSPITVSPAVHNNYAYSCWIYVNTWNTNAIKPIFSRPYGSSSSATPTLSQIYLSLDKTSPTLYLYIDGTQYTVTNNMPLQNWVYFTVSVQGTYTDMYLDGKLILSINMSAPSTSNSGQIFLGSYTTAAGSQAAPSDILITKFTYWPNALNPQFIWNQYNAGNGGNFFNTAIANYGLNIDLTNNGKTTASVSMWPWGFLVVLVLIGGASLAL